VAIRVMSVAADASGAFMPTATSRPAIDASVSPMPPGRNVRAPAIVEMA